MRGTPSCSTTSACFPIARRTWQQASAEPTASPSGRACEVSTKRFPCSIFRRTSCNILLTPFVRLHRCGPYFFFSPDPTIVPPALFPARPDQDDSTTPARGAGAGARPVRDGCRPSQLPDLRDCGRLLRHPRRHRLTPARTGRRPRGERRSLAPGRYADRRVRLPPKFPTLRAELHPCVRDGTLLHAFPHIPRSKTDENIRKSESCGAFP